jgi:hypothetical protein
VSTTANLHSVPEHEIKLWLRPPAASYPERGEERSKSLTDALQRLVAQLESDTSFAEPNRLRERLNALDRLDAYFPCVPQEADSFAKFGQELSRRVKSIRARFEVLNADLYEAIRRQIQRGVQPHSLLRWLSPSLPIEDIETPADGMGYDYIDELISGVFRFEEPEDGYILRHPEKSFYQPTPGRHIFNLIGLTALTSNDVFVDIGSGLGHVPMMVSICTESRSLGIELEAAYVERAQQCARGLNLNQVTFIQQDAREADLSSGTVFYLYTPFTGSILSAVLKRLRREAAVRQIRVCCYGSCTSVVAEESWLAATTPPDANLITVFFSRS